MTTRWLTLMLALAATAHAQTPLRLDQVDADGVTASRSTNDGGKVICGAFSGTMSIQPNGRSLDDGPGIQATYLARIDANGELLWLELLASASGAVTCTGLAVDSLNRVYALGTFQSSVQFSESGPVQVSNGGRDGYIAARDARGGLRWALTFGGPENEATGAILIKPGDAALLALGSFRNTVDFDPGAGNAALSALGGSDGYAFEWTLDGGYLWAGAIGGSGPNAFLSDAAFDPLGATYLIGFADAGTDLDPGVGIEPLATIGTIEQVLIKLDANRAFQFARASRGLTAGTLTIAERIVVARDQIIVSGTFSGDVDFDPGAGNTVFSNTPAPTNFGTVVSAYTSSGDLRHAQWLTASTGSRASAESMVALADGGVRVGGRYSAITDFVPNQAGASSRLASGASDAYVARLNSRGVLRSLAVWSGPGTEALRTQLDEREGRYTVGVDFEQTVDFDLGNSTQTLTSFAGSDGALARYADDLLFADGFSD
jgi:hypothetical protein